MGILNAVTLLDEEGLGQGGGSGGSNAEALGAGIPPTDLVRMARQNALRLQRSLTMLLDLAALESHTFHARLREAELLRLVRRRLDQFEPQIRDRELRVEEVNSNETLSLADPQRIGRAIDLCLETILVRAQNGSTVKVRISSMPAPQIAFEFELEPGTEEAWESAWTHGQAGFEAGVGSPTSAFAGVLQAEQAFLTRTEEGLGADLILVHEIMRLHHGKFECARNDRTVAMRLRMPDLSSDEALRVVLTSRAYELSTEPTSVALILIRVPKDWDLAQFRSAVRKLAYRTTDGVYPLPQRREVAVVMDEYPREDLPKFLKRVENALGFSVEAVMVHCPKDVADPTLLWERAKAQMAEIKS